MSGDLVFESDGVVAGSGMPAVSPVGATLDLLGLSVAALPPGRVDATFRGLPTVIQVAPFRAVSRIDRFAIGGSRLEPDRSGAARGGFDVFGAGVEFAFDCVNADCEFIMECDDARLPSLAAEAWDGAQTRPSEFFGHVDPACRSLAGLAVTHLRAGPPDPLYVEGLAVAIAARALGLAAGRTASVSTRGTDARIARAVEYVEAHLAKPLSVAGLAAVACMSPSWFARAFKDATGVPVHAFVRERRVARAADLLASDMPIAQIAVACGFADQSHLTRAFRARHGVTPGQARAARG